MMKLLMNLVLGTIVLIVAALIGGFLLPDTARVERSILIDAPPAAVFPFVNGFERFNEWSPWARLDPQTQYQRQGPATGVGARQAWLSENRGVGSGSQEIVESVPDERVRMKVEFTGFSGENYATISLAPEGEGTRVRWAYETAFHGNLLNRYFGLMLDRMLGPDYEQGLVNLKQLAEAQPVPR